VFGIGKSSTTSGSKVGRPARPGETVNRTGIPVTTPKPGSRVVGSKPRKTSK